MQRAMKYRQQLIKHTERPRKDVLSSAAAPGLIPRCTKAKCASPPPANFVEVSRGACCRSGRSPLAALASRHTGRKCSEWQVLPPSSQVCDQDMSMSCPWFGLMPLAWVEEHWPATWIKAL